MKTVNWKMRGYVFGTIVMFVMGLIKGFTKSFKNAGQVTYAKYQRFSAESRGDVATGTIIGAIVVVVIMFILYMAFKDTLIPMMLEKLKSKINLMD